jgi:hypothetical protein
MASALARALAYIDMNKANRQDVAMLQRLVVEFKDELDALGVRVDQLDARVATMHRRLGGWQLSGALRLDVNFWDHDARDGSMSLSRARLFIDRWFGEDESIRFHGRVNHEPWYDANYAFIQHFWVEFPAFFDTRVTVGRFQTDWDAAYRFGTGGVTDISNISWLTDRRMDAMMLTKNFELGMFQVYAARPVMAIPAGVDIVEEELLFVNRDAWEIAARAVLQFTEQFGFDLGLQYFRGDDHTEVLLAGDFAGLGARFNSLFTVYGGLRFDFNQNIGLRGMYLHQQLNSDFTFDGGLNWVDADFDSTKAFRLAVDVKQDLLGFTSLWLGYQ